MNTNIANLLLSDLRKNLLRVLRTPPSNPSYIGFALTLLTEDLVGQSWRDLVEREQGKISTEYQSLATIGFAMHADQFPEDAQEFRDAIEQLANRAVKVSGNIMPFATDYIAQIGIILGCLSLNDESLTKSVKEWWSKLPTSNENSQSAKPIEREVAVQLLDLDVEFSGSIASYQELAYKDIGLYLHSGIEMDSVLQSIRLTDPDECSFTEAVELLAAIDSIWNSVQQINFGQAKIEDVVSLISRIPSGLRRWTWDKKPKVPQRPGAVARKWHLDHEYHFQSMLYFLLAPIFPDLTDEEHFEPVGQKQPRTDLYIPSLRLIIEAKFIYPNSSFPKLIDEIGADASTYLLKTSLKYDSILVVAWDASRRTHQYPLFIEGLRKMNGIVDAIVIPQPEF